MRGGDDQFLKLFSFQGGVWFGDGRSPPIQMAWEDLPVLLRSCVNVRVLADMELAGAVCSLWKAKLGGKLLGLQLCSPQLCQAESPDGVLLKMRGLLESASCGGWHEMQEAEYPTYAVCDSMLRGRHEEALGFLRQHPLHKLVTFFPRSDPLSVCGFIAAVRDPRFYDSESEQVGHHRLHSYLGLLQRTGVLCGGEGLARELTERQKSLRTRAGRAAYVVGAWDGGDEVSLSDTLGMRGGFLQLLVLLAKDRAEGYARATKTFVNLAVSYWLDRLVGSSVPDGLFSPEQYIANPKTLEALRAHLRGR